MEEKVVGGKEKKYVLYTVVGEERGRVGAGVWVVRVLLGTLLLVALAVVPYLSLRLAQVSDRTLVVFQPVPIRNHSLHHHHNDDHYDVVHSKKGHVDVTGIPRSASLVRDNYTRDGNETVKPPAVNSTSISSNSSSGNSTSTNSSSSSSNSSNSSNSAGGIVTLHESAVTLAVMEDTNTTRKQDNNTDGENSDQEEGNSEKTALEEAEENMTTEDSAGTSEAPASIAHLAVMAADASPSTPPATMDNTTGSANATVAPHHDNNATSVTPATSTAAISVSPSSAAAVNHASSNTSDKDLTAKSNNVSSSSSTMAPNTTATPSTSTSTTTHHPLAHKLVYVATTASGNHVGGFCVWKTDRTITRWSYFYENIPIEYQSHQDSSDHEMRGMLAAVRTWAPLWNDHHVVLRSHHPSIKGSDHPTRRALTRELEKLSEGRFSYELEWRLRKTDRVVDIAYCLSRLHRDYAQWYRTFQARVDELLGQQDWSAARTQNRVPVSQSAFLTDDPEDEGVIIPGDK